MFPPYELFGGGGIQKYTTLPMEVFVPSFMLLHCTATTSPLSSSACSSLLSLQLVFLNPTFCLWECKHFQLSDEGSEFSSADGDVESVNLLEYKLSVYPFARQPTCSFVMINYDVS